MSIGFPINQGAYSQNAGITPISHTVISVVDPGPTTIQSSTGVYKAGDFILNTVGGNLWYLQGYSPSNGVLSANWVLLADASSSPTFTNVVVTGTLNVTGLTTLGALVQVGTASINASGSATTTIGSTTSGAVSITSGGTLSLDVAPTQNISIGASQTSGLFNIGGSGANTGTVTMWGGTGNQTINFANSVTGVKGINIGSQSAGSSIIISGGTPLLTISNATGFSLLGGNTFLDGNLRFTVPNAGISFTEGADGVSGVAILSGGTLLVTTINATASCRIILSRTLINGSTALGELSYTINAGVSFTIRSVDPTTPANLIAGDTSIIYWQIVESV